MWIHFMKITKKSLKIMLKILMTLFGSYTFRKYPYMGIVNHIIVCIQMSCHI